MIIYGWGNFNRRDHSVVRGTCQSCGRYGYQSSYTSSKFFTLYFIPVIPLDVLGEYVECDGCRATWKPTVLQFDPGAGQAKFEAEYHRAIKRGLAPSVVTPKFRNAGAASAAMSALRIRIGAEAPPTL